MAGAVGGHGAAGELFGLADEVVDAVAPGGEVGIERQRLGASWGLPGDKLGAARAEIGDDGVQG